MKSAQYLRGREEAFEEIEMRLQDVSARSDHGDLNTGLEALLSWLQEERGAAGRQAAEVEQAVAP